MIAKERNLMPRKLQKQEKPAKTLTWSDFSGEEIEFVLDCPEAHQVFLCGDFNHWSPASLRMDRRGKNGPWQRRLLLDPGRYEYKFIVDGKWIPDPGSPQARNPFGTINSVLEVRA
jgi:1,4-alpha-glucan branching enzyme